MGRSTTGTNIQSAATRQSGTNREGGRKINGESFSVRPEKEENRGRANDSGPWTSAALVREGGGEGRKCKTTHRRAPCFHPEGGEVGD